MVRKFDQQRIMEACDISDFAGWYVMGMHDAGVEITLAEVAEFKDLMYKKKLATFDGGSINSIREEFFAFAESLGLQVATPPEKSLAGKHRL